MATKLENSLRYLKENYNSLFLSSVKKRKTGNTVSSDTVDGSLALIDNKSINIETNNGMKNLTVKEYVKEQKKELSKFVELDPIVSVTTTSINDIVSKYNDAPVTLTEVLNNQKDLLDDLKTIDKTVSRNLKVSENYNKERKISVTLRKLGNLGINLNRITDLSNKIASGEYNHLNYKESPEYKELIDSTKTDEQEAELENYLKSLVVEKTGARKAESVIENLNKSKLYKSLVDENTRNIAKEIVDSYERACDSEEDKKIKDLVNVLSSISYVNKVIGSTECICSNCGEYVNVGKTWYEINLLDDTQKPIVVLKINKCPKCGALLQLKPYLKSVITGLAKKEIKQFKPYIDIKAGIGTRYTLTKELLNNNIPIVFYNSYNDYCLLNNIEPQKQIETKEGETFKESDFIRLIREYKDFVKELKLVKHTEDYQQSLYQRKRTESLRLIKDEDLKNKIKLQNDKDILEKRLARLFTCDEKIIVDDSIRNKINDYINKNVLTLTEEQIKQNSNSENMLLTAYQYSKIRNFNSNVPVIENKIIDSKDSIKLNIMLLCEITGVDYNQIKNSAIYSLNKAIQESDIKRFIEVNYNLLLFRKSIKYFKSLMGELSDYVTLYEEIDNIKTKLKEMGLVGDEIYSKTPDDLYIIIDSEINKVRNKYMEDSILLYAFTEIDDARETEDSILSDWEDVVSDLMILVDISKYIEEFYDIEYTPKTRIKRFSVLEDKLSSDNLFIDKESVMRLDSAFKLYKSIKYKSYTNYKETIDLVNKTNKLSLKDSKFLIGDKIKRVETGFDLYKEEFDKIVKVRKEKLDKLQSDIIKESVSFAYNNFDVNNPTSSLSSYLSIDLKNKKGEFTLYMNDSGYKITSSGVEEYKLGGDLLPNMEELEKSDIVVIPNPLCSYKTLAPIVKVLARTSNKLSIIESDDSYNLSLKYLQSIASNREDYLVDKVKKEIKYTLSPIGFNSREDYITILNYVNSSKSNIIRFIIDNMIKLSTEEEVKSISRKYRDLRKLVDYQATQIKELSKKEFSNKEDILLLIKQIQTSTSIVAEKIKVEKLDKIYYFNKESLLYNFENDEDFLLIKGLYTIYNTVQKKEVNLNGIISVLKNSMLGNIIKDNNIPDHLRCKYLLKSSEDYAVYNLKDLEQYLYDSVIICDLDEQVELPKIRPLYKRFLNKDINFKEYCETLCSNEYLDFLKDSIEGYKLCSKEILDEFINKYRGTEKSNDETEKEIKFYLDDFLGDKSIIKSLKKENKRPFLKIMQKLNKEYQDNNGYFVSNLEKVLKELRSLQ